MGWADLQNELLDLIALRISFVDDLVRFASVCKPWRWVLNEHKNILLQHQFPWLMLCKDNDYDFEVQLSGPKHYFFRLPDAKVFNLQLPGSRQRKFLASNGWLIAIGLDRQVHLLHPFSRIEIKLPQSTTFYAQLDPNFYPPENIHRVLIKKVVLSSTPSSSIPDNDCVVMAIYGEDSALAFARPGDNTWIEVEAPIKSFVDVLYHKGNFYAVNCRGLVVMCQIDGDQSSPDYRARALIATTISLPLHELFDSNRYYLVESSVNLLLILHNCCRQMRRRILHRRTIGFKVYKMDDSMYPEVWMEYSLGDHALFLSDKSYFSISTSDCRDCKGNCIYYVDDYYGPYGASRANGKGSNLNLRSSVGIGVFNLEKRTIERHYHAKHLLHFSTFWFNLPRSLN